MSSYVKKGIIQQEDFMSGIVSGWFGDTIKECLLNLLMLKKKRVLILMKKEENSFIKDCLKLHLILTYFNMVKKKKFSNFVTTKSGKKLDKINCKLIDRNIMKKDTECVIINHENKKKKWFLKNHPDIGFNMLTNNYDYISNLTNQGLIKFIIDIDEKGQPVYGYSKRRAFY